MGFVPEAIWRQMRDPTLYRLDLDEAQHGQGKARPHVGLRCGPARLGLVFKSHKGKRVGAEPKANGKGMRFDIGSALDIEQVEQFAFPDGTLWRPEFGGVQTTLLLDKKPAKAEFEFELGLPAGAGLLYQPSLTAQQVAEGHERPAWCVGSYVLLGPHGEKWGHFPRPWAKAANGDWQWGELAIVGNTLVKRFAPTWFLGLDFGAGVKADASMGYASAGASSFAEGNGFLIIVGVGGGAGTATSASVYCARNPTCSVTQGMYSADGTLCADTAAANAPTSAAWLTQNFDDPAPSFVMTNGAFYAWAENHDTGSLTIYYDTDTNGFCWYDYIASAYVAGTLPSPAPATRSVYTSHQLRRSCYITFTAAAAGGGLLVHPGMAGGMRG